jgi:AcrR family transcriptional regulator
MTRSIPTRRRRNHAPKKLPKQARSKMTFGSILEAAAQILSTDGADRLNTNRIAERAGVPVASLYQYFPNKDAIINALFEMEASGAPSTSTPGSRSSSKGSSSRSPCSTRSRA